MRRLALLTTFLLSIGLTVTLDGCDDGGELDCRQLCSKAQGQDCTSISGDCGEFCDALDATEEPAGCEDERAAYAACLNDEGVCSGSCDADETALSSCLAGYCATRLSAPDCATLVASF